MNTSKSYSEFPLEARKAIEANHQRLLALANLVNQALDAGAVQEPYKTKLRVTCELVTELLG